MDIPTDHMFFGVLDSIEVAGPKVEISHLEKIYLVKLGAKDLEAPDTEPIALYYKHGTRRYVWRDRFWCDYDLPFVAVGAIAAVRAGNGEEGWDRVYAAIKEYRTCFGTTIHDYITSSPKTIWRVLYEVKD